MAFSCPGSPSPIHAKCELEVEFDRTCQDVIEEISGRINGHNGWTDPKAGEYLMLAAGASTLEFSRTTADEAYTDLVSMGFLANERGCSAHMCSESQVFSVGDFDTNYCNMRNLYCGLEDGCALSMGIDLEYEETFSECSNPFLPAADSCFTAVSIQNGDHKEHSSSKGDVTVIVAATVSVAVVLAACVAFVVHRRKQNVARKTIDQDKDVKYGSINPFADDCALYDL